MRTWFALVLCAGGVLYGADSQGLDFFETHIRPVLVERCYQCHSAQAKKLRGGLMLDSAPGMKRGGDSGKPAVVPGQPEKSRLISAILRKGKLKMPPGEPLPPEQVADFEEWIKMGAPDPRTTDFKPPSPYNLEEAKKFWSFQPVADPAPPKVSDAAWSKTAIDRFIKAKLDEKKLKPVGLASKRALIRRATYDLTGLPPTPADVTAFIRDTSANAFDKVIDRLLASPQYGEKWGRHWLDEVRYADTSGNNADFPVPDAYRYRNWVIRAFNQDVPYDEFLREQIAGDLLPAKSDEDRRDKIIATGYLAIARRFGSGDSDVNLTIDDTIDNLGKATMGLTIACARCHDHKFDPIPQRDYYALYGIFASTKYAFPGTEAYPHERDFVALNPVDEARLKQSQDELSDLDHHVWNFISGTEGKDLTPQQKNQKIQQMKDRMTIVERDFPKAQKAYAVSEGTPHDERIQRKGNQYDRGAVVPRGFLQVLGEQTLPPDEKGSGRRELAQWITGRENPLMARVMVNRIWQWHFGKGIVDTPNDFGTRGDRSVNPQLLDWLATRFRESGYSIKAMHRLIMRTRAYRLSAENNPADAASDPKNQYQWRFDRRRLDAEEIRDSMLALAGDLDPSMGGREPFPPELTYRYTQHVQFFAVYDTQRRSVYLMQQRLKRHPFLEVFDGADPNASTPARDQEETSLQALTMMNSAFVEQQADLLAVRVGLAYQTEAGRIGYAYKLIYGRAPARTEIRDCERFLAQSRAAFDDSTVAGDQRDRAALASLMHVLLASNEFMFVE